MPNQHIGVIGDASNKISTQTGGWTITWQGRENSNSDFVNTRTIYESIKNYVEANGGSVEFSSNGKFQNKPDVVIGVLVKNPMLKCWVI
jgi:beta-glucosidase